MIYRCMSVMEGVEPEPYELGEHLIMASSKLILIDQLLSWLHGNGHKVLLFSQMTSMLDILQDYLGYRGRVIFRLFRLYHVIQCNSVEAVLCRLF